MRRIGQASRLTPRHPLGAGPPGLPLSAAVPGRGFGIPFTLLLAIALWTPPSAFAHEVQHEIRQARATVITLTFADGQPFGGEAFEAAPLGTGQPVLSGRTDPQGRAVILAEVPGSWRLRAWSDDGHGVDLRFEVAAAPAPEPSASQEANRGLPRWALVLVGLAVIALAFALVQRLIRRPDSAGARRRD